MNTTFDNFDNNDATPSPAAETKKTKKQSSQRRIESSRANGRKSKGPTTPEGLARSSQNARKHGVLSTLITLTPEDEQIFNLIFEQYANRFQPRDQAEYDIVEEITFYKFQMRQCWIEQASAMKLQIVKDRDIVDAEWSGASEHERRVLALAASIKDGNTIVLLQRYARTLSTQAERAMKTLADLQKQRIPPPPASPQLTTDNCQLTTIPNDPNPTIEHPAEAELTTDNRQLTTEIFAYSSPQLRVTPLYTGRRRSEIAAESALKAMAA